MSPQQAAMMSRNGRRLEWYIRITLYVLAPGFLLGGLFTFLSIRTEVPAQTPLILVALLVLGLLAAVGDLIVAHIAISRMRTPQEQRWQGPASRWGLWVAVNVVATLAWCWFLWESGSWPTPIWVFGTAAAASVIPLISWRATTIATAVLIAVNAATIFASPLDPRLRLVTIVTTAIAIAFILSTTWITVWMLRVVYELDDARLQAAELAVTEERLRIARDLHDLLGKTLTTVAVKSGLAAELVRRGRHEEAESEISAVRQIAEGGAKEARTVVRGDRHVDLARELEGAKALLDSAGIDCTVTDHVTGHSAPGPHQATPLGWVVREGVTNIIRHSNATRCLITLTANPLQLMITNNGVHAAVDPDGTGLHGMAERLVALGGTLEHHRDGNTFTLTATMGGGQPLPQEDR